MIVKWDVPVYVYLCSAPIPYCEHAKVVQVVAVVVALFVKVVLVRRDGIGLDLHGSWFTSLDKAGRPAKSQQANNPSPSP